MKIYNQINNDTWMVLTCIICGEKITDIRNCNNPWPYPKELYSIPIENNHSYYCCKNCNLKIVLRARMEPQFLNKLKHKALLKSRKQKLQKLNENR